MGLKVIFTLEMEKWMVMNNGNEEGIIQTNGVEVDITNDTIYD